jgi:glutamate-1-semialdehyde aminotransferase
MLGFTDRANDDRVWDVEGKEYIDMLAAYGCVEIFLPTPIVLTQIAER